MNDEEKELKSYYVYELVDSSNNEVFYVGKGQGRRAFQHEEEAKSIGLDTPKLERIRIIENEGDKVITRVIGRYTTDEEALAVESTLIHWVHGYENLTNLKGGKGHDSIRPKGDMSILKGIDIPENIRSSDGTYSQKYIELREKNDIVSYMEKLKEYLEKELKIQLSDVDISEARFTKLFFPYKNTKISVGTSHSPKKLIWIGVESIDGKQENKEHIIEIGNNSNLEVRNNGSYAKLPNFKSTTKKDKIAIYFKEIIAEIDMTLKITI